MKIFGREPALLYAVTSMIIMLIGSLVHLTTDQQGALNGAVLFLGGLWLTWKVAHEKAVALLSAGAKTVFALILAFGAHVDPVIQAEVMSLLAAVSAFWLRGQVVAPIDPYGNEVPKDLIGVHESDEG